MSYNFKLLDGGGNGSVALDTTLKEKGKSADAKAVGDRFDAIIGTYSEGLAYTLKDNGEYEVSGIGACTDTDIIIPSVYDGHRVTSIGARAFDSCSNLTSIVIPDSVTSIGFSAFIRCSNLTSVVIPKGVTEIQMQTFFNCQSLTRVTIPDSVTIIGLSAFYNCINLESIVISKNVTHVGEGAFNGCIKAIPIYCEAETQPEGWESKWNINNVPVVWGAKLDFAGVNRAFEEVKNYVDQALGVIENGSY